VSVLVTWDARRRRSERGTAAVEFALVMMPLVVLLFGAIQYGLYFWAMQGGSDIARSAARLSSVDDNATRTCVGFGDGIRSQIDGLTGDPATATITRTYTDTSSPAGIAEGDTVKVSVRFKSVDLHFPFVPFVHDGLVTASATSRVDYVKDRDNPPGNC
jgi:Flp pilus assembly protein TadG